MLTIALFITVILLSYFIRFFVKKQLEDNLISREDMSDQEAEQVRCSSSESDNFEKIDSDEVQETNGENPLFTVGEEPDSPEDDGPAHEGGDSFPNAPPPNIRRVLTPAQQLALAEKRSKLRSIKASEDGEW